MTSTLDPQPTASTSTSTSSLHRTPSRAQTGMINTASARRPTSTLFNRFKRASSSSVVGPDDLVKRVGIWTEDDERSKDKESMSEASLIDREWEEVDWERVKTLPMVCLIPPEEDEVGPVTLYPLLPPLPPPPTATHAGQGPTSVWGGMANGFVRPPPVFSRTSPAPGRGMYGGAGRGVVMPKTKNEVVAARSRRLAREMIDGPSTSRRAVSMVQPDIVSEITSETMMVHREEIGDRAEGAMEMLSTDDKVVPGEDRLPPLSAEACPSDRSDRPSPNESQDQVRPDYSIPTMESTGTCPTAQIPADNEEPTPSDSDGPPVQPILASRVPIPPPLPPKETTIDPPIIASRSSEPDQAPSTDKRRQRTFSLTSLLASKSHKSVETPPPPVPPLPQDVNTEERGRPRVRKQKSLKQMFFASDEPLPPVPALPIMRRSESETVSSNRNLDPSPDLRDDAAAAPPTNAVQTELSLLDNERTPRPVSVGPASPPAQAGPSRMIKRFSLSNMSGAFKKMAAAPSSKKDVPPVPFLPEGYRPTPDRECEVTPRQRGSTQEEADRSRTRTRTESGFSTSTSTETESPTCHTLTSVSPRTQRDPSASPALRDHIHRVSCSSEVKVENTHHRYQSLEATIVLGSSPFPRDTTAVDDEEPSRGRVDRDDSIDSIPSQSDTYESNGVSSEDHQQLKTPIPSASLTMDEIRGPMPTIELDRQESRYEDAQDQIAGPSRSGYSSDSFQSFHSAEQGISISPTKPEPILTSTSSGRDRGSIRRLMNPRTRYHSSPDPRPLRSASPPSTYSSKTQMGRKLEEAGHLKSLHFDDLGLDFEEFQGEWAKVDHDSLSAVRAGTDVM